MSDDVRITRIVSTCLLIFAMSVCFVGWSCEMKRMDINARNNEAKATYMAKCVETKNPTDCNDGWD